MLHVITFECKYYNTVNCSIFFLSEFEEMRSCIYCVETAKTEMGLSCFWHHPHALLLEGNVPSTSERICNIQFITKVCNLFPMFTLHFAVLRTYNG